MPNDEATTAPPPEFLKVSEVAQILRCSLKHVYNMIERNELEHRWLGKRVVVPRAAVYRTEAG